MESDYDLKGSVQCVIRICPLNSLLLIQLVDFEAMTTPSPESFSKTAKSWMNLKRWVCHNLFLCVVFNHWLGRSSAPQRNAPALWEWMFTFCWVKVGALWAIFLSYSWKLCGSCLLQNATRSRLKLALRKNNTTTWHCHPHASHMGWCYKLYPSFSIIV